MSGAGGRGSFPDHFSDRAESYARFRPPYPLELVDFLANASPGRGLAWDAGAGSGQLSLLLAERFERVHATDASVEQISRVPPHPRVSRAAAPSSRSGLASRSVDLIVAAQAAHWFELGPYYAEATRVGRSGAVVALVSYATVRLEGSPGEVVDRFYRETLAAHWPPERRHVEAGYGTLPFPFEEVRAPDIEMRVDWTLADLLGYLGTWSAVRALERSEGVRPVERMEEELAASWGDAGNRRKVRWPLGVRVGMV